MNVSELFSLKDRVALITGGSRGLGLQIAEALGEAGARVVLTARKQNELDEAQAHLAARSIDAVTIACDLQDLSVAQALPGRVLERCQRLDILVNNAGTTWGASAEAHPLEAWHKVINLNLNAVFALTQATMPGSAGADGKTRCGPRAKQMFQIEASEISPVVVWKIASSYPAASAWRP